MNTEQNYTTETVGTNSPSIQVTNGLVRGLHPLVMDTVQEFYETHLAVDDTDGWLICCLSDLTSRFDFDGEDESTTSKVRALTRTIQFVTRLKTIYDASLEIEAAN